MHHPSLSVVFCNTPLVNGSRKRIVDTNHFRYRWLDLLDDDIE
jgi:hypothetical protein